MKSDCFAMKQWFSAMAYFALCKNEWLHADNSRKDTRTPKHQLLFSEVSHSHFIMKNRPCNKSQEEGKKWREVPQNRFCKSARCKYSSRAKQQAQCELIKQAELIQHLLKDWDRHFRFRNMHLLGEKPAKHVGEFSSQPLRLQNKW